MGLREQKKLKTRKAISDLATRLFAERGYHAVTTAEIAARAEVSVPTLFKYFPVKEALVFDEDQETEARLVGAVVNREKGQTILDALYKIGCAQIDDTRHLMQDYATFVRLIANTLELNLYSQQMWMRYEQSLGAAIQKEAKKKLGKLEAEAIARFVLDAYHRALTAPQPKAALRALFKLLAAGWSE